MAASLSTTNLSWSAKRPTVAAPRSLAGSGMGSHAAPTFGSLSSVICSRATVRVSPLLGNTRPLRRKDQTPCEEPGRSV
jgi:hypothetical protein